MWILFGPLHMNELWKSSRIVSPPLHVFVLSIMSAIVKSSLPSTHPQLLSVIYSLNVMKRIERYLPVMDRLLGTHENQDTHSQSLKCLAYIAHFSPAGYTSLVSPDL